MRGSDFNRPLWRTLRLSKTDPYGGLFGPDGGGRKHYNVTCTSCGAVVSDRGLHYRFHVQLAQMIADIGVLGGREILSTITDEDETIEIRDGFGNVVATLALGSEPQ